MPETGENRITGMIANRPDWVVSRQRAWGVPITVFVARRDHGDHKEGDILRDEAVNAAIADAFAKEGADAWFAAGSAERFLGSRTTIPPNGSRFATCSTSGSIQARRTPSRSKTRSNSPASPASNASMTAGLTASCISKARTSIAAGSTRRCSKSCGTRGRAPYDVVLTHGFILDEKGDEKMSKSKGNVLSPQEVMKTSGADILRLWVASADTTNDIRFGPAIVQSAAEAYRKLRNTLRWMLGALHYFTPDLTVPRADLPELESLMLHRLAELDGEIRAAYAAYDYRQVIAALSHFMNTDLSAFYFDIRKDTLYCESYSSPKRRAALTVIEQIFGCACSWLAPILAFTAEEAWLATLPFAGRLRAPADLPGRPEGWRDDALAAKWETVRAVRRVVTGALELERAAKRIGSSLEAAPQIYITDAAVLKALEGIDVAEICITSGATHHRG